MGDELDGVQLRPRCSAARLDWIAASIFDVPAGRDVRGTAGQLRSRGVRISDHGPGDQLRGRRSRSAIRMVFLRQVRDQRLISRAEPPRRYFAPPTTIGTDAAPRDYADYRFWNLRSFRRDDEGCDFVDPASGGNRRHDP